MQLNFKEIITAFMVLFAVIDIIGNIPIIIDLRKKVGHIQPHQVFAAGDLTDPHGTHRVCLDIITKAMEELGLRVMSGGTVGDSADGRTEGQSSNSDGA